MLIKRILDRIFGFGYYQYERLIVMTRRELKNYFDSLKKDEKKMSFNSLCKYDRAVSEIRKILRQKYNIEIEIVCYNTFISEKGHLNKRYSYEVRILGINLAEPNYESRERFFDVFTEIDFHSYEAAERDAVEQALNYLVKFGKWDSRYAFGTGNVLLS